MNRSIFHRTARRRPIGAVLAASLISATLPGVAHAVAVDPGDYTYLPPGTGLALLYYQHASGKSLYSGGHKVSGNADLDVDVGIARGVKLSLIHI